jgi:hypothetical protein
MANKVLIKMIDVIIVKWGILFTYLPYLTTFLPNYLPTYYNLPTHPPIYLATDPLTSLFIYLPATRLSAYPSTHLLITYLPTYLPNHPPTSYNISTYVFHSFVMMCQNKHVKYKIWQMLNTF